MEVGGGCGNSRNDGQSSGRGQLGPLPRPRAFGFQSGPLLLYIWGKAALSVSEVYQPAQSCLEEEKVAKV